MKLQAIFSARRAALLAQLPPGSVALLRSGAEQMRNSDVDYPFRAQSDFYYLTGFNEPDAILCLYHPPGALLSSADIAEEAVAIVAENPMQVIFLRPKDIEKEIWQGRRLGVANAPAVLGLDEAHAIDEAQAEFLTLCSQVQQVYFSFDELDFWQPWVNQLIAVQKSKSRQGVQVVNELGNLNSLLHAMRLVKSQTEIECLRQAAQISVKGHLAAMKATRPGCFEYQIQAALEAEFKMNGSPRVAFNSIVASGDNACILHYTENDCVVKAGDLVLVDAGAEWASYAGDITTTFPANGRFSEAQAALYQVVFDAQQAVIAMVQPGVVYEEMHKTAVRVITEGLVSLGILQGNPTDLIAAQAYKPFFMHGTGHWLGMDVHDVGSYKLNGNWQRLVPGMVFTVEPGLYIATDAQNVPAQFLGIGIRIEDDVLVTPDGCEVLTQGLPRTLAEIEHFMQQPTE